jgi:hypothetical protein
VRINDPVNNAEIVSDFFGWDIFFGWETTEIERWQILEWDWYVSIAFALDSQPYCKGNREKEVLVKLKSKVVCLSS